MVEWQEVPILEVIRERERKGGKAEAWGYANHQESLSTRLAPLTKALGVPEGNLGALAEK